MKRKRCTEEQISGVLQEVDGGATAGGQARRRGVSEATIYNWKAKYGGLDIADVRRLRSIEDENAKLKKLLADIMLGNASLKGLFKKWSGLPPSVRLSPSCRLFIR
jgi:putative transposase